MAIPGNMIERGWARSKRLRPPATSSPGVPAEALRFACRDGRSRRRPVVPEVCSTQCGSGTAIRRNLASQWRGRRIRNSELADGSLGSQLSGITSDRPRIAPPQSPRPPNLRQPEHLRLGADPPRFEFAARRPDSGADSRRRHDRQRRYQALGSGGHGDRTGVPRQKPSGRDRPPDRPAWPGAPPYGLTAPAQGLPRQAIAGVAPRSRRRC